MLSGLASTFQAWVDNTDNSDEYFISKECFDRLELYYWETSWEHLGETVLDGVGLIPVIGIISKGDELYAIGKHSDNLFDIRKLKGVDQIIKNLDGVRVIAKKAELTNTAKGMVENFVGKVESEEVDFVAMNNKGTIYYQVAASVRDETTLARELRPLHKIAGHYPKYVLTLDEDLEADYDGIRRINALDFLKS